MRTFSLEERAAYAAVALAPVTRDLRGIGHRITQPRDDAKAWRTWEHAASAWRDRRRGRFAQLTRFRLPMATETARRMARPAFTQVS